MMVPGHMHEIISCHSDESWTSYPVLVTSTGQGKHLDRLKLGLPAAEGEGAKVLVDGRQQSFGSGQPQWYMPCLKVLHIVAGLQILMHQTLACTASARCDATQVLNGLSRSRPEEARRHLGETSPVDFNT